MDRQGDQSIGDADILAHPALGATPRSPVGCHRPDGRDVASGLRPPNARGGGGPARGCPIRKRTEPMVLLSPTLRRPFPTPLRLTVGLVLLLICVSCLSLGVGRCRLRSSGWRPRPSVASAGPPRRGDPLRHSPAAPGPGAVGWRIAGSCGRDHAGPFRNPPGRSRVIGVSAGAGAGRSGGIVLGGLLAGLRRGALRDLARALGAFCGGWR